MTSIVAGPADSRVDVAVVGSGAAGLATAVRAAHSGLHVVVVEKSGHFGGATAWSGGWMWTPRTHLAEADGVEEPETGPRHYLQQVLGDTFEPERVDAFLRAAPEMAAFFESETALQFVSGSWIPDIYGHLPDAGTGSRSLGPAPYDARELGELGSRLRGQLWETSFLGMGIMSGPSDLARFLNAFRSGRDLLYVSRRVATHLRDLLVHRRGMQLVNGQALIGRLLRSAADLGVLLQSDSEAVRLLAADGRVTGVVVRTALGDRAIHARAVVLAAGGFPHDVERRARVFPGTPTGQEHWSLAPESASGDGLRLAESVGGQVRTDLAAPAAWCPVSLVPHRGRSDGTFPHIIDRAKPGVIGVLRDGRRFVNEANGYHDYVSAMLERVPEGEEVASWLICDHTAQRRYPFGYSKPFPVPVWPYVRTGYLVRAQSLGELAERCGIDPRGLESTVETFNRNAVDGRDPDFGRGSTAFNRSGGDQRVRPNPSLAAVTTAPFYAIKVLPGSFGTFAGIRTDPDTRVLRADGSVVEGLHAVGTDAASVMGGHYPAGGIAIGPAMTFGFITGRYLAEQLVTT